MCNLKKNLKEVKILISKIYIENLKPMNLENKIKQYEIELKDYIPIYGWFRYQIRGFKAGKSAMREAILERSVAKYLENFGNYSIRTSWLSLYNIGYIYSFIVLDSALNLGIVDKMQKLVVGE